MATAFERLLEMAAAILREEELAIWMQFNPPDAHAAEGARRHGHKSPFADGHSEVPVFGDPANEYEKFSARYRMDAQHRAHRQEHLRVACAAQPQVWPPHRPP